jgi:diguanylate cyclase (GGDEF)-like protein/PAS domain S-box-containing protein
VAAFRVCGTHQLQPGGGTLSQTRPRGCVSCVWDTSTAARWRHPEPNPATWLRFVCVGHINCSQVGRPPLAATVRRLAPHGSGQQQRRHRPALYDRSTSFTGLHSGRLVNESIAVGPYWDVRGRRGHLHALGVLDPAPDPAIEAVAAFAARLTGRPVTVSFRDGSDTLAVAGGSTSGLPADPSDPPAGRVPICLGQLEVGEVVGVDPTGTALSHAAAGVADLLSQRLDRLRVDERGQPIAVVLVDELASILWASAECEELTGHVSADLVGKSALDLLAPDTADAAAGVFLQAVVSPGRAGYMPQMLRTASGEYKAFEVQTDNMLQDPEIGALALITRAVPEPEDEHSALGDQIWVLNRLASGVPLEDVLARVVELVEQRDRFSHACVTRVDSTGATVRPLVAPRMPASLLRSIDSISVGPSAPAAGATVHFGQPRFASHLEGAQWDGLRDDLESYGYKACWSAPVTSLSGAGELGSIDVYRLVPGMPSAEQTRVLLVGARLASVALDNERNSSTLRFSATHDALTGLANRQFLVDELERSVSQPVGLLSADLDRFDLVNDTLGHSFGDDLLREVALRLSEEVGPGGVVARFAGAHFVVLLPGASSIEQVLETGRRLVHAVSEPYSLHGKKVLVGLSAGATFAGDSRRDRQGLIQEADAALHHVKKTRPGHVESFQDDHLSVVSDRLQIEATLREVLDQGRLGVAFQPEVRISGDVPTGVEALARCRLSPDRELSPGSFIPVAEEVGLIPSVFDSVLEQSCEAASNWNRGRQSPLVVWINLAPQQLGSAELLPHIERTLDKWHLEPRMIGLEVTEQGIIPDANEAIRHLREFTNFGLRLAIDDFGIGQTSLGYLQELPVDTVKLDATFVARAEHDVRSRAIVQAVVQLAAAIGLACVAEGVETLSQLELMRELGCEVVQGYVYSRPVSAPELTRWLDGVRVPHDA